MDHGRVGRRRALPDEAHRAGEEVVRTGARGWHPPWQAVAAMGRRKAVGHHLMAPPRHRRGVTWEAPAGVAAEDRRVGAVAPVPDREGEEEQVPGQGRAR